MVTIKAIAARCGCSPATVSKALNGAPDVGRDMVKKIRSAAAEMGYIPNGAARALKTARTYNLGLLFQEFSHSGLAHEFFSLMLNGFKSRAEELGYDISFISSHLEGRGFSYVEHARYRKFDGVAVITVNYDDPAVRELAESDIPTVTVDYEFPGRGCVMSDNDQGVADLVQYVHSMGHRRIAFIHGEQTAVTRTRLAAFFRTCGQLGVPVPKGYVIEGVYHDPDFAAVATERLLNMPEPPTCILYPDDISYMGGLEAAERRGLSIPEDVSAVGYDGIAMSQFLRPSLTTMRQNAPLMGARAAEELSRAVTEGRAYSPERIVIPGVLLAGETVKRLK